MANVQDLKSLLTENNYTPEKMYEYLPERYPDMAKQIGSIARQLDWDGVAVLSLCLHLLEDANYHTLMKQLSDHFSKVLSGDK